MAIKFDKNFLAGLGGGIATGANKVIQADLAANSAKVSKMAGFAAERALKKRDEYDADLKEFEKGAKELAGMLGGKDGRGMDAAQFLISEYGTVEAATAASVDLIANAKAVGTSVYEQLKLKGALDNRVSPTGRQLALTYVPKPIQDDGKIKIRNSGWASILQGEDASDKVERVKQEYLSVAGIGNMPQLEGDVAPVLQGISAGSVRQVPKDLKESLDRSNIKTIRFKTKLETLQKDPIANKKQIKEILDFIAVEDSNIKNIREQLSLSAVPDIDKEFDKVTTALFPYFDMQANDRPFDDEDTKEYNKLINKQKNIVAAMEMKAGAKSTARVPGSSFSFNNAMAWVKSAKEDFNRSIGWKTNIGPMEWLTQMRGKIQNGQISRGDLPIALQSLVNVGEKASPELIMDWHKSNMDKAEMRVYTATKRLKLDLNAEQYLLDLDGVKTLSGKGDSSNMLIESIPEGSITGILDQQPEKTSMTSVDEMPRNDGYNPPKTDTSNNYIVDPVTRISNELLNDNSIMKIIKDKGGSLQGENRNFFISKIKNKYKVPIRTATEALDNVLSTMQSN
tara:strand:+ start:1450 stop:3150 length:1701 start_codon:yes stop_codon:yes gene_type:complete